MLDQLDTRDSWAPVMRSRDASLRFGDIASELCGDWMAADENPPRSTRAALLGQSHDALDQLVLASTSPDHLAGAVGRALAPVLAAPLTAVMSYDQERDVLRMTPGSFGADGRTAASYQVAVTDLRSNTARVFATGQPYFSNDAPADPGIRPDYVRAFGIRRLLSLPLRTGYRRVGVLHLANRATDFGTEDVALAQVLAPRIAMAVETVSASFRLHREQRLERILSEIAFAVAAGQGVQVFLSPALEELGEATDASVIALVFSEAAPIVSRAGNVPPALEQALLKEARTQPPPVSRVVKPGCVGDPGMAVVHTPVFLRRRRIGTLAALRARGEPFAHDEHDALSRVAQLAALTWATERYQQQGAQLARLEERQRISDELHDDVRNLLFQAERQLDVALVPDRLSEAAVDVARSRSAVLRASAAVREVVHHLARPASAELALRLRAVVAAVEDEFPLDVVLDLTPAASQTSRQLRQASADVLVKVAREALVNAAKHGGRCRVVVRLDVPANDRLRLTVEDDGIGMTGVRRLARHGLSILSGTVREHGGRLRLQSVPAGGTRVVANLPL
jgi:signal transduction histidine kinase